MGAEKSPFQPLSAEQLSRLTSQERIDYIVRAIEETERRLKVLGRINSTREVDSRSP